MTLQGALYTVDGKNNETKRRRVKLVLQSQLICSNSGSALLWLWLRLR